VTYEKPSIQKKETMKIKFKHTNIIAKEWKKLSLFYQEVFGCVPVPPELDIQGELDSHAKYSRQQCQ